MAHDRLLTTNFPELSQEEELNARFVQQKQLN